MKKKILFCTESGHIKSGYGNYTRELLSRLYDTHKYEIAELSCYRTSSCPKTEPWKIYPNAVDRQDERYDSYNSNFYNQFGQWRFDLVAADFKPDIVVDFRDIFMSQFQRTVVFRNKYHWILAPTIDSIPIRAEWLDALSNCDTLLTHTKWAKNAVEDRYNIPVNGVVKDSINTDVFQPLNKISVRQKHHLNMNMFIVGSVMRNQKRKLIPDILKIAEKINSKNEVFFYLHTSYPETKGWNIPELLIEHNVWHRVLFTYVCKSCSAWHPMLWHGPNAMCPTCNKKQLVLANVSHGVSDQNLAEIYNMFDVYLQYAICEGFGIPPLEAASCGIPFITVGHGAMKELGLDLDGKIVPVQREFTEHESGADRVLPDNDKCIEFIEEIKNLPEIDKYKIAEELRQNVLDKHSWDKTSAEFERVFDNITVNKNKWNTIDKEQTVSGNRDIQDVESNRDFVYNIIDTVLQAPKLKSAYFIQQVVFSLDNGFIIQDEKITPFTKESAVKVLEVWYNNKVNLNKFLNNENIININSDFLEYT